MAPRRSCSFLSSLKINIQCPVVFTVLEKRIAPTELYKQRAFIASDGVQALS